MMPPETVRAIAAELPDGEEYPAAVRESMRLLVNHIASRRGLHPPWILDLLPESRGSRVAAHIVTLDDLTKWGAFELGTAYEQLMNPDARKLGGSYYTPPEAADFMVRFSIGPQLDRLAQDPDPLNLFQVCAIDPACGAGVFLLSAGRFIATRITAALAARAGITEITDAMVRHVLPHVLDDCVFGVDIDPVAVDLAKSVLWLEIGGSRPITFMDRNIVRGNALEDEMPPKWEEIYGPSPRGPIGRGGRLKSSSDAGSSPVEGTTGAPAQGGLFGEAEAS